MSARAITMMALLVLGGCDATSVAGVWCQYPADCRRPNECSYHRCRPPCTSASDCPGTQLCLAGHCAVDQDQGCGTIPGRTCASPLVCAEDHCTLQCTTTCASGATCRPGADVAFSICVAPSSTAPLSDGGGADALDRDAALP